MDIGTETNYKPFPYWRIDSRKFFEGYVADHRKHPAENFSPHPDDDREGEPTRGENDLAYINYRGQNKKPFTGLVWRFHDSTLKRQGNGKQPRQKWGR